MSSPLSGGEIAIVGMAGRFPGAPDVRRFWENIAAGVESIEFLPEANGASSARDFVPARAMLDAPEYFDAGFFGFSPREAELMDPQHRVLLECAWDALEAAGYDPLRSRGAVGVYVGAMMNTYLLCHLLSRPEFLDTLDMMQINVSNGLDFLATRVSYKLGLQGPSYTLQSACSTSLVAVHTACQSLLQGACDMALAGGVAINLKVRSGYRFQDGGILSPDGHCRAFDANAQGTVFGSGVGVVVLKRAKEAIADGDTIRALIKGSAVNNDGAVKVGFTAPSVAGQAAVISEALANAGVEPDTIGYVEAHGTGTPLGDPIEIRALTKAYRARTAQRQYCAIGSVKTNVGHLDAASGIAGLIKTVLALEQGSLPPSLHFVQPNPQIDFASSPFYVNDRLRAWPAAVSPRRAAVSAFGVGGTNAHVIVEEAPAVPAAAPSRPWQLLMLSSKSATALETATGQLVRHLREQPDVCLADVAYTLAVGRGQFEHRKIVVCQDAGDAVAALVSGEPARVRTHTATQVERPVVFMFPGQGAQRVNMGRALYEQEPGFRTPFDACAAIVHEALGLDLAALIYPAAESAAAAATQLAQTWVTQPALFAVEYALAQLWRSWGIEPAALIGHSVGEYVAACLAGVFDLDTALRLVIARGQLMQAAPPGAMLAVSLSEAEARGLTSASLSVAAINGPTQCVLAGTLEAVAALEQRLGTEGIGCRRLHTSHAFHSALMDPVVAPFEAAVARVPRQAPRLRWISNVTGQWMRDADATDPAYWARHLREPVRLYDGLTTITTEGRPVLLEVGPGDVLSRSCRALRSQTPLAIVTSLPNDQPDTEPGSLQQSLGQLWLEGVTPDWSRYFAGEGRRRIPLPTYPFERERYWIEPTTAAVAVTPAIAADVAIAEPEPVRAPMHPRPRLVTPYIEPVSALEKQLAVVWQQALGVNPIGLDDNFFDLGGDSLIAVQLMATLRRDVHADVPVAALYECLTVRLLAQKLHAHADSLDRPAPVSRRTLDRARRAHPSPRIPS